MCYKVTAGLEELRTRHVWLACFIPIDQDWKAMIHFINTLIGMN